jgi:hypothetical protein
MYLAAALAPVLPERLYHGAPNFNIVLALRQVREKVVELRADPVEVQLAIAELSEFKGRL